LGSHLLKQLGSVWLMLVCGLPPLHGEGLQSGEVPLHSSGELAFDVDIYQMKGGGDSTRLEICYTFDFNPAVRQDSLTLIIRLGLTSGSVRYAGLQERKALARAPAGGDALLRFVDIKKFSVLPDTLDLQLSIEDSARSRRGEVSARFRVRDFSRAFSIGDPVFLSSLHRPDGRADQNFLRSGLLMLPNPSRIYSSDNTTNALFYFEINGLPFDPARPGAYSLRYTVRDMIDREVFAQERADLPVTSANSSRVEKIPLQELAAGVYRLTVQLTEQGSGESVEAVRYFQLSGPKGEAISSAGVDEESVQKLFDQISWLVPREEKAFFNGLNKAGKAEYIVRFWLARDPTPGTPENEAMVEHFRRLNHAGQAFKGGLKADMARIYIQYGPPMEVRRMASTSYYASPVEIWTYGLNGSTEFVFVDRTGDGAYQLMHSNHPDEIANPEWESQIN
jgi:GWxTD domain-containing protein